MILRPEPESGPSSVTGELFIEEEGGGRLAIKRRVKRAGVAVSRTQSGSRLSAEDFELAAFVFTDDNGVFTFDSLLEGTYQIKVDWPGIPMDAESDIIFEVRGTDATVLEAVVDSGLCSVTNLSVTGIKEKELISTRIYPNPSHKFLNIELQDIVHGNLEVMITDMSGRPVRESGVIVNPGKLIRLNIESLPGGVYLVRILDPGTSKVLVNSRIILQD